MSFLTAEWRKLAIANYIISPEVLKPFVPYGTELDFWQDRCYVSLIGFRFVNTRVLGIKVPFHVNFDEVNLRFYVRRKSDEGWRRGVVFIKEIVPKPAITWVANTLYKEHYETRPMRSKMRHLEGVIAQTCAELFTETRFPGSRRHLYSIVSAYGGACNRIKQRLNFLHRTLGKVSKAYDDLFPNRLRDKDVVGAETDVQRVCLHHLAGKHGRAETVDLGVFIDNLV